MKVSLFLCLAISVVCCHQSEESTGSTESQMDEGDQCPPWYFFNTSSSQCECYSSPSTDHIVKCTEQAVLLKSGYCMTHKDGEGLFVSLCNYFEITRYNLSNEDGYISLPNNISELNDYMCGPLNRKGVLCSECINGFGPSITSIGHTCSNCSTSAWYGVPLYLFLEFVPITVFYFIVLFFRINATSAPMIAFVFYCQIGVSSFLIMSNRYLFNTSLTYHFLNILITFYGIWNLDFFRYIIPPFCVSPHIKSIHITFLYYISAFYPLCLIAITWICIELYSRNFKFVVWLWSKVKGCLLKTNAKLDVNNTMIDVFATFFLLSYAKLVFTSFRTISYGITINAYNFTEKKILHVKSDQSIGYFSTEHLPFAIASTTIIVFLILPLPLLLALFPINAFRTLLFKCGLGNRPMAALNLFLDKFYSCYRDGLDGGRDMRSFVSVHFVLRVLGNYLSVDEILVDLSFSIVILLYFVSCILFAIVRPYKRQYMNVVDTLIFANMALLSLVLDKYSGQRSNSNSSSAFYEISGSVLSTIPLLAITGIILYRIFKKQLMKLLCCTRLCNSNILIVAEDTEASVILDGIDDPELPDRMLHPECYVGQPSYGSTEQTQHTSLTM